MTFLVTQQNKQMCYSYLIVLANWLYKLSFSLQSNRIMKVCVQCAMFISGFCTKFNAWTKCAKVCEQAREIVFTRRRTQMNDLSIEHAQVYAIRIAIRFSMVVSSSSFISFVQLSNVCQFDWRCNLKHFSVSCVCMYNFVKLHHLHFNYSIKNAKVRVNIADGFDSHFCTMSDHWIAGALNWVLHIKSEQRIQWNASVRFLKVTWVVFFLVAKNRFQIKKRMRKVIISFNFRQFFTWFDDKKNE